MQSQRQRSKKRRVGARKNGRRARTGQVQVSLGLRGFQGLIQPPVLRRKFTYTQLITVNNAAQVGANTTVQCFSQASAPLNGAANVLPGFSAFFGASSGSLYQNFKVLGVVVRASMANAETFPVRGAVVISLASPANNTLQTANSQIPYIVRQNQIVRHEMLGPLTGNGRVDVSCSGSLAKMAGVQQIRGLTDFYANYYDQSTGTPTAATSGLSVVFMVLSTVNLVSGVQFDYEIDLMIEFWGLDALKTT